MIIGITGNSGTGKTEISKILAQKLNAEIIDADEVAKELTKKETKYLEEIMGIFGNKILKKNGLNRKKIAKIIFKNETKRNQLNSLTFKYVVDEIKSKIEDICNKNIVIDAPLLFESGLNEICNYTIAVISNKEIKIDRICKRDNITKRDAKARLNIQHEDEYYIEKSNYTIKNNGNIDELNWEEICTKIGKN